MPTRWFARPRGWTANVLLLLCLPTLAAAGALAAFVAFSGAALRLADESVAWSHHANLALAEQAAVAQLLDTVEEIGDGSTDGAALEVKVEELRRATARSLAAAASFGAEEFAEEREIEERSERLVTLARAAVARPGPEAIEPCRRLVAQELLPAIQHRVHEEHEGAESSSASLALYARSLALGSLGGLIALLAATALLLVALRGRIEAAISTVVAGASRLGAGELDHRIAYEGDDELGALAAAFNTMAGELEQSMVSKHRLEAQVEERTRALEESRLELQRRLEELERTQTQLIASERLSAIGLLAASVAHEINNPLAFVLSNVEFALEASPTGRDAAEVDEALREAREGARRVRDIVRELKSFARGDDAERTDLGEAIATTLHLAANEIRHRATLELACDAKLPLVKGNAGRFGQVVLNLVMNALEAMPERPAAQNVVRVRTATTEAGWACFEVEDNGAGMSREVLARLFEPFFSTKPPSVGTGLGLSICRSIVEQSGGTIVARSEPGRGSTFRVELPPSAEQRPDAAPVVAPVEPARRLRVLIVDDEPLAGRAAARALKEHDVETLQSAAECLARLEHGARFDAIVCDLMMPEMSGAELLAELERRFPAQAERLLFLTGGAFSPASLAFLERSAAVRLTKPFEAAELRAAVTQVAGLATVAADQRSRRTT